MSTINHDKVYQQSFQFNTIAVVESPYQEKFAIPRQPNLVSEAQGKVILVGQANQKELIRDIEQYSHLWLLFIFHGTQQQGWKPLVRPPRLGGNSKTGVLATRSTFRPNPIGMSVVKLDKVSFEDKQTILHISGLDLLNGTPIIDIKPYIPYSDAINDAHAGFAQTEPQRKLTVTYTEQAQKEVEQLQNMPHSTYGNLSRLISQILAQDPRPAYKQGKNDDKLYGMRLYDLNIQWKLSTLLQVQVLNITKELSSLHNLKNT